MISDEAVEAAERAYETFGAGMRDALEAAYPLLVKPECLGDGVCTNPRCERHGIKDTPVVTDEAVEAAWRSWNGMRVGTAKDRLRVALEAAAPLLGTRPAPDKATDSIRDALALLVQLKDGPRDQVYYDTRDEAWQSAREALAAHPAEPVGVSDEAVEAAAQALRDRWTIFSSVGALAYQAASTALEAAAPLMGATPRPTRCANCQAATFACTACGARLEEY